MNAAVGICVCLLVFAINDGSAEEYSNYAVSRWSQIMDDCSDADCYELADLRGRLEPPLQSYACMIYNIYNKIVTELVSCIRHHKQLLVDVLKQQFMAVLKCAVTALNPIGFVICYFIGNFPAFLSLLSAMRTILVCVVSSKEKLKTLASNFLDLVESSFKDVVQNNFNNLQEVMQSNVKEFVLSVFITGLNCAARHREAISGSLQGHRLSWAKCARLQPGDWIEFARCLMRDIHPAHTMTLSYQLYSFGSCCSSIEVERTICISRPSLSGSQTCSQVCSEVTSMPNDLIPMEFVTITPTDQSDTCTVSPEGGRSTLQAWVDVLASTFHCFGKYLNAVRFSETSKRVAQCLSQSSPRLGILQYRAIRTILPYLIQLREAGACVLNVRVPGRCLCVGFTASEKDCELQRGVDVVHSFNPQRPTPIRPPAEFCTAAVAPPCDIGPCG